MATGLRRLAELGAITPERAKELEPALHAITISSDTRMITPGVLEVIARKC
jgi:hypothetical protein